MVIVSQKVCAADTQRPALPTLFGENLQWKTNKTENRPSALHLKEHIGIRSCNQSEKQSIASAKNVCDARKDRLLKAILTRKGCQCILKQNHFPEVLTGRGGMAGHRRAEDGADGGGAV